MEFAVSAVASTVCRVAVRTRPGVGAPLFLAVAVFQSRVWGCEGRGRPTWGVLAGGQAGVVAECHIEQTMPHPDPDFVWSPVSLGLEQSCALRRADGGSFVRVNMQEQVAPRPQESSQEKEVGTGCLTS